jgi:hypothetical protein
MEKMEEKKLKEQITNSWDKLEKRVSVTSLGGVFAGTFYGGSKEQKQIAAGLAAAGLLSGLGIGVHTGLKVKKLSKKLKALQIKNNTYRSSEWNKGQWYPPSRRKTLKLGKKIWGKRISSRRRTKRRKRTKE